MGKIVPRLYVHSVVNQMKVGKMIYKIFGIIAVFVTSSLFMSENTDASTCGTVIRRPVVVSHPPVAIVPIYEPPVAIAIPILVPAYQFQYSPPCVSPGVGVLPGAPGMAPIGPAAAPLPDAHANPGFIPGFGSKNDDELIKRLARAVADELRLNKEEPDDGPPVAIGIDEARGGDIKVPSKALAKEQLVGFAQNALERSCKACHTGIGSKGDTVIFTQPGIFNPNAPWKSIAREVLKNRMPPSSSAYKLTREERNFILEAFSE